jgi:hypothetical protein
VPAITDARAKAFPIGELSKHSGVNIETIRYYERAKMLAPPPRTASGRRVYGSMDLRILVFIRRSRELGFSLGQIRTLLRLGGPERATCREVREIGDVVVKVGDVIVGQPDAAGGDVLADGPRLVGAWIRYSVSLLPCHR